MTNKELVIMCVSPSGLRFAWENYIYLNNLREKGLSDRAQILIFIPHDSLATGPHPMWRQLETDFPETQFFYYPDKDNFQTSIVRLIQIFHYIPLLRPYCLSAHFKLHPELSDKAIFYTDSDILLMDEFDFTPFLSDDVCYMSDAKGYTNSDYFDSKVSLDFVDPAKFEEFKKRDVLQECAKICGITREIVEANKNNSGAAQYLLKNIDYVYWNQVFDACIELRTHLMGINAQYMRSDNGMTKENNGFQSWGSDIWAVVWNLWKRGYVTSTPKEFDFAWATDDISRLKEVAFYHNAGITDEAKLKRKVDKVEIECPAFFKGAPQFISENAISPFHKDYRKYLNSIISNPISQSFCNGYYAKEIAKVAHLYNL
jgi:hypothetical protein